MEHVKFPELIKPVNETTSSGTPAVHFNVPSLQSKPPAASPSHRFQLGVVACLVLVFFLSRCYQLIGSRLSKAVDKRRLASGGGTSGEGDEEREGDVQCAGPSEPAEDDETPWLKFIPVVQSNSPESKQSGFVGFTGQQASLGVPTAPYGVPLLERPRETRRDRVRKNREKLSRAISRLSGMLQAGMEALNDDWNPTNPHSAFCVVLLGALKQQQQEASTLFNENNRSFGTQERIIWIGSLRSGYDAVHLGSSVLSAFAIAHGLPDDVPSNMDFRVHTMLCVGECSAKLGDAMREYMDDPVGSTSLANLTTQVDEASFWLRVVGEMASCSGSASRPDSTPFDPLDDALRKEADSLGQARLQAMRMLSQI